MAFTFPSLKQSVFEKPGILKMMLLLSSSEAVSELQRFAVPTGVFLLLLHSQHCRLVRLEQSRTMFFLCLGLGCTWDSYCLTCYCLETITARRKKMLLVVTTVLSTSTALILSAAHNSLQSICFSCSPKELRSWVPPPFLGAARPGGCCGVSVERAASPAAAGGAERGEQHPDRACDTRVVQTTEEEIKY